MRLDHLLSKEHLDSRKAVQGHDAGECSAVVAHGWNVDYSARLVVSVSTASAWNTLCIWSGRARCWVLRERSFSFETAGPVDNAEALETGDWSLLEN